MIVSNLYSKTHYRASDIQFLLDVPIREYDITKANISILRDADMISEEQYQYLYRASSQERYITIGQLQGKDTSITKCLQEGIANAKRIFVELNNVNDYDILFIRNDAITLINKQAQNLNVTGRVSFRLAGNYTSFYNIDGFIDLLYFFDVVTGQELLDVKGIGATGVSLHMNYMIDLLKELFYTAQILGIEEAIKLLGIVYKQYVNREMDIEYYREFNPRSQFRMNSSFSMVSTVYADYLTNYDKRYIDISQNQKVLMTLNRVFSSLYFGRH